jgi:hypothetical protein
MNTTSKDDSHRGRSAKSDRPFDVPSPDDATELQDDLAEWTDDFDARWRERLEIEKERQRYKLNNNWALWRQGIVLSLFVAAALLIVAGVGVSVYTLLSVESGHRVDIAKWVLETMLGALVAGIIGFAMVKSFEK